MRDIDAFQHHWFVMDKAQQNRNEKCDYLGTGGSNRIVMQGNKKAWGSIQIWMHEFGHSLALGHASMMKNGKVDEYGDDSSAMNNQGAKQMPYSGFHTVILKWAKPRVQLLAKDISNIWQTIELQKMGHSDVFGLLVEVAVRNATFSSHSVVIRKLNFMMSFVEKKARSRMKPATIQNTSTASKSSILMEIGKTRKRDAMIPYFWRKP